jgi:hypothetical protein
MKDLNKILNINPMVNLPVPVENTDSNEIDDDFDYAHRNMHDVIDMSNHAIGEMLELAKQSQHPRAFEVLNQMFKTATEMNKDLLDLQKKKKELNGANEKSSGPVTQNLFVGSTAELQEFLMRKRSEPSE